MASDRTRLLKFLSLGVGVLSVVALLIVGTVVWAQVQPRKSSPLITQVLRGGGTAIGVQVRDVDDADVKREKLSGVAGAVVEDVRADSAAAKAGMKAGDVIVSFDGERIRSAKHLERLVSETPAGRTVDAAVIRSGDRMTLKVAVVAEDAYAPFKALSMKSNWPEGFRINQPKLEAFYAPKLEGRYSLFSRLSGGGRLGVGVQDLTEQLGDYFGTSNGALVTAVDDNTPAKTAGIKAGDVITKIDGETVRNSSELRQKLSSLTGEHKVTFMRDKREQTVTVKFQDEVATIKRRRL
jgi:serine protease Do